MPESHDNHKLAEAVHDVCFHTAQDAYEDARIDGLCHEGAWEVALDTIRSLDVRAILENFEYDTTGK